MCRADITPYLVEEQNDNTVTVRTDALYRCRDFESIKDWTHEHVVAPYNVTQERLNAKMSAEKHDHHSFGLL
jgi:hypothetical protein